MPKTKKDIKEAEDFVRRVLAKNFNQKRVDADRLRVAAEKLCEAIPDKGRAA